MIDPRTLAIHMTLEQMALLDETMPPGAWVSLMTIPRQCVPVHDLRVHEFGPGCWCDPVDDGEIVSHDAADGRARYERGEAQPH